MPGKRCRELRQQFSAFSRVCATLLSGASNASFVKYKQSSPRLMWSGAFASSIQSVQSMAANLKLNGRAYLALYLVTNLSLTLYNKALLGSFPFPYFLTGCHTMANVICIVLMQLTGGIELKRLSVHEWYLAIDFSFLYSANIAVSNLSLEMVPIPIHQTVRATSPFFVLSLTSLLFWESHSLRIWLSLVPIVTGVVLATSTNRLELSHYFRISIPITLIGSLLAALKTILTGRLQHYMQIGAADLLLRLSIFACAQSFLMSYATGEMLRLPRPTVYLYSSVFGNGLLAMLLNLVSFSANRKVGPLAMTVAANVKQVFVIILGSVLFQVRLTQTQACGIVLALVGGLLHSMISARHGEEKKRHNVVLPQPSVQQDKEDR